MAGQGRYIVTLRPGQTEEGVRRVSLMFPAKRWISATRSGRFTSDAFAEAIHLEGLDIVFVSLDEATARSLEADAERGSPILAVEPDYPTFVEDSTGVPDVTAATAWNLDCTGVKESRWTGRGITLTVLDASYDGSHPDLKDRVTACGQFVPGLAPNRATSDHGSATLGIAAARRLDGGMRYGIAVDATVHFAKVVGDDNRGWNSAAIAGIYWAVGQGSHVVSLSVASQFTIPSAAYDRAGAYALDRGCLVLAGAGNTKVSTVHQPANCWSIMAIGAVNQELRRSKASSPSGSGIGAKIDLAAPGEQILSACRVTRFGYTTYENGTSFAAPHVAGIAALWAEATGARGRALWQCLTAVASPIDELSSLVGTGLIRAPGRVLESMRRASSSPRRPVPGTTTITVWIDPAKSSGDEERRELQQVGMNVTGELVLTGVKVGPVDTTVLDRLDKLPGKPRVAIDNLSGEPPPSDT